MFFLDLAAWALGAKSGRPRGARVPIHTRIPDNMSFKELETRFLATKWMERSIAS